ncbi:hypothetical protein HanHA89_Chr05g0202001 [Helianthus annuus]|nr:hypothetical protein HanHA89_Chr05g0202001 [Helianthus annuus]
MTHHENLSTRIKSINNHLPLHRTRYLHSPIRHSRRHLGTHPIPFPHMPCSRIKTRQPTRIIPHLSLFPTLHCILNMTPKLSLQFSHKYQSILR